LSVKPGGKTAVATLQQPHITGSDYSLHPTTIDQCLQLLGAASAEGLGRHLAKIPLPTSINQLYIRPAMTGNYMQAQAIARPARNVGDIEGEMLIAEGDQILLAVKGCKLSAFEHESDVDIDDRIAAARLSWRPDLDFIPLDSLMISHVKDPDAIKMVEAYGLLCTQEMQERIRGVECCADHFTKFSHWIDNHVEEGRNARNELVTNSTELLNLPREERLKLIVQLEQQLKTSEFNNVAELITRLLDNCVDVFKGDSQILDIYLRDNGLTKLYAITGDRIDSTEFFATAGHTNPTMKILEIGAGTGGTTLVALQSLCSINGEPMYSKYTFTDISSGFFSAAKDRFAEYPGIEFKTLDISRDPQEQGFELGTYDLIVASNVIHATDSLYVTLSNVRKLLHPRGRFFLQELTPSYAKMINIIMGPLPGWWLGGADGRGMEPIVSTERWDRELRAAGFSGIECAVRDDPRLEGSIGVNMIAKPAPDVQDYRTVTLLTLADQADSNPVRAIEQLLVDQGYHIAKFIFGEDLPPFQDVISLVELNGVLFDGASPEQFKTFQQVIAGLNSARLLWVMRAAQIEPQSPTTALTLGLARSIRTELNIPLATLEVDTSDIKASNAIVDVFEKFRDTASEINPDYEYVYHNQQVLVGRYHWTGVTKELAASHDISGYPLRLEGDRSGSSRWVPVTPQELEPDGVQVASAFIGVDMKVCRRND
jgi:SAM-dependent methyltransferase